MPFLFLCVRKKRTEELSKGGPSYREATQEEEDEEVTFVGDVFAPQHDKRLPRGAAPLGKRVPLTAADKKKVDKFSIGLPVQGTLKLFTYNCRPFLFDFLTPLHEFRDTYPDGHGNVRGDPRYDAILEARLSELYPVSEVQQRISQITLSGVTLCSAATQQVLAEFVRDSNGNLQSRLVSSDPGSPLVLQDHSSSDHVTTRAATEPDFQNFISNFVNNQEVLELIERNNNQRIYQVDNTMPTETNTTSVAGSNNTRPSGSFSRSRESNARTSINPVEGHPGNSLRQHKNMPSGSQLPSCWTDEMDEFICHMEAQGDFSTKSIVKALKQRFTKLREQVIPEDAIQRRIDTLDNQDNSYFKEGSKMAIAQAEANGYEIPPFNPENYPMLTYEVKPDHVVLGTSPGNEALNQGYEYSLQPRLAGGIDIDSIKIGPDTPKKTLAIRTRPEANPRVQNAGTYSNTRGPQFLADITNDHDTRPRRDPRQEPGNDGGLTDKTNTRPRRDPRQEPSNNGGLTDITNTLYNARTTSNPNRDLNGEILGNQVYSTPAKSSDKAASSASNDTIRAINNGSPTPTRGLYRSGRENALSSSTTGTSILSFGREGFGRENSGGPTLLERRRARQENRDLLLNHGAGDSPRTP